MSRYKKLTPRITAWPGTEKQRAHLKMVHEMRRGVRVKTPGISPERMARLMLSLRELLYLTGGTEAGLARALGITKWTLRNRLAGTDWPDATETRRMLMWVASIAAWTNSVIGEDQ